MATVFLIKLNESAKVQSDKIKMKSTSKKKNTWTKVNIDSSDRDWTTNYDDCEKYLNLFIYYTFFFLSI